MYSIVSDAICILEFNLNLEFSIEWEDMTVLMFCQRSWHAYVQPQSVLSCNITRSHNLIV